MCQRIIVKFVIGIAKQLRRPFLHVKASFSKDKMLLKSIQHQNKFSKAQIFSWFILLICAPIQFISTIPLLTPYPTIFFLIALLLIYIQVIILTVYQPCPTELKRRREQGIKPAPYDPLRYRHVIERGYCNICQMHVKEKTKHCRKCNMCVEKFDHHCVWLNNCIGRKNYRLFFILLSFIAVLSCFSAFVSLCLILFFFTQTNWIHLASNFLHIEGGFFFDNFTISAWLWMSITCISLFVHLTTAIMTVHLFIFHVKLLKNGSTTYGFIVNNRPRKTPNSDTITNVEEQTEREQHNTQLQPNRSSMREPRPRSIEDSSPRTVTQWAMDEMETARVTSVTTVHTKIPPMNHHLNGRYKTTDLPGLISSANNPPSDDL